MFCFIVLLLAVGAGFYFYQKLIAIENEIRAERKSEDYDRPAGQQPATSTADVSIPVVSEVETEPVEAVDVVSTKVEGEPSIVEATIVAIVTKQAGTKQTDLYGQITAISKKQLQQLIKEMADRGVLRREKKGSSYLLYIA